MLTKTSNLFIVILSALVFTSCQKEFSIEDGVSPNNGGGATDCKSCSYYPMCNGSKYDYVDTIQGNASERNAVITVVKDTVIAGKTFTKLTAGDGFFNYYNCTNGESRIIAYNATGMQGTTADVIDLIMIKANQPVNSTWTDIVVNQGNQNVEFRNTIAEKGISRKVLDKDFTDVIRVRVITGIELPQPVGFFAFTQTDYYFAKNIGLIEAVVIDINSETVLQHTVLKSYSIP